jgi:hypothetical protein
MFDMDLDIGLPIDPSFGGSYVEGTFKCTVTGVSGKACSHKEGDSWEETKIENLLTPLLPEFRLKDYEGDLEPYTCGSV